MSPAWMKTSRSPGLRTTSSSTSPVSMTLTSASFHRLAESQRHGAVVSVPAVNQVDGKAVMRVGAAKAVVVLRRCRSRRARRKCAGGQNGGRQESEPVHTEILLSGIVPSRTSTTWRMRQQRGGIAAISGTSPSCDPADPEPATSEASAWRRWQAGKQGRGRRRRPCAGGLELGRRKTRSIRDDIHLPQHSMNRTPCP